MNSTKASLHFSSAGPRPAPEFSPKVITIFVGLLFVLLDGIVGIATAFFVKPISVQSALPHSIYHVGHPYKAYAYPEDDRNEPTRGALMRWRKGSKEATYAVNGRQLDYGVLSEGIKFDQYNHGVLPTDVDISGSEKKPGEKRIVFLGGSTTFQPWPFLTAELLTKKTGFEVHAISMGTGGYTSQENLVDLALTGFEYKPDLAIAYLPVNDVFHAARWPGFKRDYSHFRTSFRIASDSKFPRPQSRIIGSGPFAVKLVQTLRYNSDLKEFISKTRLDEFTTRTPHPDELGIWIDENSFQGTVRTVIDNILNMKALCDAHHVPFVVLTQKMFATNEKFYQFMEPHVLKSIHAILTAPELKSVTIYEMEKLFPDNWNYAAKAQVNADFPNRSILFDEGMSYDNMHFSPSGLYLFASIVADKTAGLLK